MTKTIKVPGSACRLRVGDSDETLGLLQFADSADEQTSRSFSMVANSGKPILGHAWWGNLGINLKGITFKQKTPALKDHDPNQRIGFTNRIELTDKGMLAEGQLLKSSIDAQQILAESGEGYPWQASVHLKPTRILRVREDEEVEVNGFRMKGPGYVFEKSVLREVSITALGADDETSAAAFSEGSEDVEALLYENETDDDMSKTTTEATELAEAQKQATENERQRSRAIFAAAGDGQHELAQQLVSDGAELSAALAALLKDSNAKRAEQATKFGELQQQNAALKQQLLGNSDEAQGDGNSSDSSETPLQAAKKMSDGPEKWAALFEHDPEVKAEFTSKEAFVAYMRRRAG